jgi:hypothetical protein
MSWVTYCNNNGERFPLPTFTDYLRFLNKENECLSALTRGFVEATLPKLEAGTLKDPRDLLSATTLVPSDAYLRTVIDLWNCYDFYLDEFGRAIETSPGLDPAAVWESVLH